MVLVFVSTTAGFNDHSKLDPEGKRKPSDPTAVLSTDSGLWTLVQIAPESRTPTPNKYTFNVF